MRRLGGLMIAGALATASPAFGALYAQNFNVDSTASWTVNNPGLSDIDANFFYDYSAIGVPSANGSDTRGMKLTANNSGGVFSGFSVSPTGQSFSGDYTVSFDLWQNYVGPLGPGGNGTTQLSQFGIGTSGTVAMWPGAALKESVTFAATLDGGSASDYRLYSSAFPTSAPAGNGVYAAPGGAINDSAAYYAGFGTKTAPAAQLGLFPGQTGTTDPGEMSFAWRRVEIEVLSGTAYWLVDGLLIASTPLAGLTLGGGNILFGHADTNAGSSTNPNDFLLNVTLIDNIVVTPEPASLALLALGGLAMLRRRQ